MERYKLSTNVFAVITLLLLPHFSSNAQTGPGGVGDNSSNHVWLDAHALGFADGAQVALWNDLSGNSSDFNQANSDQQPVYNTTGISGIPSLTFDGFNDILTSGSIPALESSEITYFIVYDRTTTTSDIIINADYASSFNKWRTYMNPGQNTIISAHYSPTIKWVRYTDPAGASFYSTHITPTNIRTYNQGVLGMSRNLTYTTPTGHNSIYLGNRDPETESNYTFTGEIAEVVVFNSQLNDLERILVENYLGVKYNMSIPTDLYDYEATHRFGLVALGNDGTNTQTTAQGAGILEISGATEMGSNEYFLVAHDDFAPDEYNETDLPPTLPDHQRLERTWRVGETGEVGTTTLTFNLGTFDFAASDSYRLLVDTDGTFTDATALAGTYDAGSSSITFTVDMEDGDFFTLAGIQEILNIHSITDGNWSETATWDCGCIPSINDSVFIDPGTTVSIDTDGNAHFLEVVAGGSLEASTDNNLNLVGNWQINGSVNLSNGSVSLIGSTPQTVGISTISLDSGFVHDIIVNNSSAGNVEFASGKFVLDGTLSPNQGNIVIGAGAEFIIASISATEGGRVGEIIAPTTISGNFSVQRNLPAGVSDWRNLCSPVVGSTFDDWDPDLAMSGPGFPDGCAYDPEDPCFKSVRYTDHSIEVFILNSYEPITNGRGFDVFVGNSLETFNGSTITSKGTLNGSGDVVESFTTGWTIMGNPYASPIAYQSLDKTSPIGKYYYVYDAASGVYQWYDEVSGTSSVPEITSEGLIATGQAVWIFANSAGTVTFRQSDKRNANATFFRGSTPDNTALAIKLSEKGATYNCALYLEELAEATDGMDEAFDIRHFSKGNERGPAINILQGGELFRKNYINNDGRDKTFALAFEVKNTGHYTISAENWANFRSYNKILLHDSKTGQTVNLKEINYIFDASAGENAKDRFKLVLTNEEEIVSEEGLINSSTPSENAIKIVQMDHLIDIIADQTYEQLTEITVTNILGQTEVYTITKQLVNGSNLVQLPATLKGVHIIQVKNGENIINQKVIL